MSKQIVTKQSARSFYTIEATQGAIVVPRNGTDSDF